MARNIPSTIISTVAAVSWGVSGGTRSTGGSFSPKSSDIAAAAGSLAVSPTVDVAPRTREICSGNGTTAAQGNKLFSDGSDSRHDWQDPPLIDSATFLPHVVLASTNNA